MTAENAQPDEVNCSLRRSLRRAGAINEADALRESLRVAFLHVLTLGSRDLEASKWYADELATVAVREVSRG